ncbi:MAG: AAA family ATPase [Sulfurimonas sp. RIFOXYD12_FULL_33_39]|uniref:AAA family ATPase n=1 Tax=unclassified Sulfurimonas TaxID=2623549 RepID=UPI0008B6B950|nr:MULTISPECIES: AAA family ATPase [unclassified Sulfurimonas]OHE09496.1 MAG: AAA family ATPase [Sulfurimonas sp. RIFOXYD12_FULL_33_39]OHE12723.1 MAG: AAA family ATPase [Sulfurimonas sp. RIFOXYD2_FULL_34_21]DAB28589.1 MAG TPA: AAA family ATPase [Sulfurimonas sp. UBA10385]
MVGSKSNKVALFASAFLVIVLVLFAILRDNSDSITLKEATKILENRSVKSVIVSKEYVYLKTDKNIYKIASSQLNPSMLANYKVVTKGGFEIVVYFLLLLLLLGFALFAFIWFKKRKLLQRENVSSNKYSSSLENTQPIESIKSDVTFSDIGGISDVKIELEEIIDFMKKPKRYKSFGARMPRGVLLVGPPGVGKTMIAKAVANAAGVPFYYQSGASFVQIYVGMGAKRVHELFVAAKNNSPSIIFIDEIDAVGKKRDGQRNDEREATLNQLLTEMDGFENSSGVIVIAATNKIDVLDSALLRAGRFDRRIFVELPTKKERASILSKYLDKVPHELNVDSVANMTVGFNGASLAALVNEASLLAIRQHDFQVTIEHFHQVKDKVMFGKKKLQMLSEEQKRYRVTYQAAKVICATYFDLPFEKLLLSNEKLTPSTDEPLIKHELESRIKMLLAGIVACNIKYNEHASSAKNDLDEAKEIVDKMIQEYGMGSSLISSEHEKEIMMKKLYDETRNLLESLQDVMKYVESVLNERESITKADVKKQLNEVL